MINKLLKLTNYNRLWLTLAFVAGLVRIWLSQQPQTAFEWTLAVIVGIPMTLAAYWLIQRVDARSEKAAAVLTILIVSGTLFVGIAILAIPLLAASTSLIAYHIVYRFWLAGDVQPVTEPKPLSPANGRTPFPSVASTFARRHGPYALYNLSCCLLN